MNDFAIDISLLVPASYTVYRPVIADAFGFFLSHLSPRRQEEIHLEQSRLPPEVGLRQRFTSLIRCCPSLHKLGQVMSAHYGRTGPPLRVPSDEPNAQGGEPSAEDEREALRSRGSLLTAAHIVHRRHSVIHCIDASHGDTEITEKMRGNLLQSLTVKAPGAPSCNQLFFAQAAECKSAIPA